MSPLIGILGIIGSLYYAFTQEGGGFKGYLHPGAIVLLAVAPPSIMLLSHSFTDFITGFHLLFSALTNRIKEQHEEVIEALTHASKTVRSEGLGAILPLRDRAKYPLLRDGLSLIVNDFKADEIRNNLMARVNAKQTQMSLASHLFQEMSKVSPGVGMIGTLMGLIGMLSHIEDPSKIGSNMALAMITTLYGLIVGTIIYAPFGEKIALEAERTLEVDLLVVEGVLNIKGKKSSAHLKDLVQSYAGAPKSAQAQKGPKLPAKVPQKNANSADPSSNTGSPNASGKKGA